MLIKYFKHIQAITFLLFLTLTAEPLYSQAFAEGDKLPDIVADGINGEEIRLSSLEGKMVLVDFWAGWCAPCRKENPMILDAYLQYKDAFFDNAEGFTVFSVSLDTHPAMWEAAVKKDSLIWPYHVSDLKGFKGPVAKAYAVKSIPQSYLIDGDGIVVAVNPRGELLEKKLRRFKEKSWLFF